MKGCHTFSSLSIGLHLRPTPLSPLPIPKNTGQGGEDLFKRIIDDQDQFDTTKPNPCHCVLPSMRRAGREFLTVEGTDITITRGWVGPKISGYKRILILFLQFYFFQI
jgi:hypothetical protein